MANLRVGLIGCGGMMRHHLWQFYENVKIGGVDIVALCDVSDDSLNETTRRYPQLAGVPQFKTHQAMLDSAELDAVVIASPHAPHREHAEAAFAKGLHVLVEKPLSCTVADCRALISARDTSGKVGAVSYQRHGMAVYKYMKEVVSSGRYGKLLMLNSSLSQDWLRNTSGSWRQSLAISGGGQINDSGSHMIDVLLWILGVQGHTVSAFMDNRGSEVDINSVVNIVFDGGTLGSLTIIGDAPIWQERHSFWFEEACLFIDDEKFKIVERSGVTSTLEIKGQDQNPLVNFFGAIRGENEVNAPFECGLQTIALTEAAWRSREQGGVPIQVQKV